MNFFDIHKKLPWEKLCFSASFLHLNIVLSGKCHFICLLLLFLIVNLQFTKLDTGAHTEGDQRCAACSHLYKKDVFVFPVVIPRTVFKITCSTYSSNMYLH